MVYSDKLIRGISNPQMIDDQGKASGELFHFEDSGRIEGFSEVSINWYDDEGALDHILNQRKQDSAIQFKVGAAIILRNDIDHLIELLFKNLIYYDRDKLPDNIYHGNILRKSEVTKQIKTTISQAIALKVNYFVPQNN
jgi:hypothetical protein